MTGVRIARYFCCVVPLHPSQVRTGRRSDHHRRGRQAARSYDTDNTAGKLCAVYMQELEFLHSVDDSDDELPMPLAHRSFLQNIYDALVIAIQRWVCNFAMTLL